MRYWLPALVVLPVSLAGCGHAPVEIADRRDYLAEATRVYPNERKERLIEAAEKVIKSSDPGNVEVRYTGNGFIAQRKYFVYAVLAAQNGQEKWEFNVEERPKAVEASLSISDAGVTTGGYSVSNYDVALNSVPLYRLFWKRVEYMLGKRPNWPSCDAESEELKARGINPVGSLGGLCGPTSGGRNNVPEPLPSTPLTAGEKIASAQDIARSRQMR